MKNPVTKKNLELDGFNEELKLALKLISAEFLWSRSEADKWREEWVISDDEEIKSIFFYNLM